MKKNVILKPNYCMKQHKEEELINMSYADIDLLKKKMDQFWIIYPFIGFAFVFLTGAMYLFGFEGYTPILIGAGMSSILLIAIPIMLIQKKKMQEDIRKEKKLRVIGKIERKIVHERHKSSDTYFFSLHGKIYQVGAEFNKYKIHDLIQLEIAPTCQELLSIELIEDSRIPEDASKIERVSAGVDHDNLHHTHHQLP